MGSSLRDRRYGMPAETRKFGGKIYKYYVIGTKVETEADKERLQNKGWSVRITKYGKKFAVYYHK